MSDYSKEFNEYYSGNIQDYALVKHEIGYSILNINEETSILIDDVQMGNFFVDRLLELGVNVYANIKDIPGWGTKKRDCALDMHPQLKQIIEKISKEEKMKRKK